jgi:uncharacterized protein (TIRG00374 family)
MRRALIIIASVVVSALLLWLALRNVPLQDIGTSITQANPFWLLIAFACISAGLWTRGERWRGLMGLRSPALKTSHILNIGFMLNLLPLRAGEVLRSLLATRVGVPFMTAATSVVVERMIDTLLVVLALIWAISRLPNAAPEIVGPTTTFGVLVIIAFLVLIFFARFPKIGHQVLYFAERIFPFLKRLPLERQFDNVLDGLKPLTHLKSAVHALVWTFISWGISLFTIWSLIQALNITGVDQLLLAILGLCLASFSIAVPVTLASLGPFQIALLVAGQAVGLGEAESLSLGFLFHGVNILGYIVWGMVGLFAMGISLGDVMSVNQDQKISEGTP